jgi:hypothetical protein
MLADLATREEIREVIARYCRGADRLDWDLVRSCFHADARDEHGFYDGDIDGMIAFFSDWSASNYRSATHFVGNQISSVEGDSAISEAYCVSYLRLTVERAQSERFAKLFDPDELTAVCADARSGFVDFVIAVRFVDRFERRAPDGTWLIAHRVVVHEWDRLDPVRASARIGSVHKGQRNASDLIFQRERELRLSGATA